jgi:hypothetical protein
MFLVVLRQGDAWVKLILPHAITTAGQAARLRAVAGMLCYRAKELDGMIATPSTDPSHREGPLLPGAPACGGAGAILPVGPP